MRARAAAGAAAEPGKDVGEVARIDVLEPAAGALAALKALETLKALEARLAFGVDLAAVELAALLLVAEDLVGGVDLGEFRLRLGVVGAPVRVVLLGEFPVGALDLRLAGGTGDPEHVIGIAHCTSSGVGERL